VILGFDTICIEKIEKNYAGKIGVFTVGLKNSYV
jgi:hypothetical protein